MKSLFVPLDHDEIVSRLTALKPGADRQWGKMTSAQMLGHCVAPLDNATGVVPRTHSLLGKLLAWLIKRSVFSEKPFRKNGPTDPAYKVTDERDFERERTRLFGAIQRFTAAGPDEVARHTHPFFGDLTGEQWGQLMYKHIDHHLQQFGA